MITTFDVTGMTCSACSAGIERTVGKMAGVRSVEVSLMGKSMRVDYDEGEVSQSEIIDAVTALGYGAYLQGQAPVEKKAEEDKKLFVRFIISICVLIPLLYVSMGHMVHFPLPFFIDPNTYPQWFALYQAVLSAVIVGINYKFFSRGFMALIRRVPNMDTLIALGSGVSFIYSLVLTVLIFVGKNAQSNAMNLHFESAATILALVTLGKWLEEKSKKRTGSEIEKLLRLAPDEITVERDGEPCTVPMSSVNVGDIAIVKQGDYVPVDGVIIEGHTFVDKSAITGESMPVELTCGDTVTTASVNVGGVIKVRAERVGAETTLSKIVKLVQEAGASKAPIQKFADKVAGIFVPAVTALALITFLIWMIIDRGFNPAHCVTYAISVLVVSCPCALGLATPVAIMTATGKAASLGVLYKDAENLQKMREVNCVLLDKTATITCGKPEVCDVICFDEEREFVLNIAGGIEANSNHPLAKCISEYCGAGAEVENFEYVVGCGAKAEYDGKKYLLGNTALLKGIKIPEEVAAQADELAAQGKTVMYLAQDKRVISIIAVADSVKESSGQAIALLKERGMRVAMLTGDSEATAKAVAESVNIDDFVAEVKPEDKLRAVENMQQIGGIVAMVGDGINDSPALKQADVGVAIGDGTDVAIDSAGVVLVSGDLRALDTAIDLSRATVRNIKQNLFWAFFYNVIAIPVAAGALSAVGLVFNPMIAAACMSVSSLFVVCNALRLLLYKNKRLVKGGKETQPQGCPQSNISHKSEDEYMKKIVNIEGMCCAHCAARVEKALSAVENVVSADVKLKKNLAVIRSREEVSDEDIKKVVEEAGYKVVSIESK